MSDVFRAHESELAISRETLRRFSLYIVTLHPLAPVATHRDNHVWM